MSIKKEFVQIPCQCGSEHIVMEPQDNDDLSQGLYFAIFTFAYDKPSFWHRFKHIWHTLVTGVPFTDQVCLDLDRVKKLNRYLENYIALAELESKHKNKTKKGAK